RQQVELFIRYKVPVIEVAAFSAVTEPLVYCRIKGLSLQGEHIIVPRRMIAKCSHVEVARHFLMPPPLVLVENLLQAGDISAEEARLSQMIPLVDDLAIEADSGGHTDQGVAFALLPVLSALKEEIKQRYSYQEEIMLGCGGGIGTPAAIVSAFALGADFVFTGSINQCSVESGAHDVVKDILSTVGFHDTAIAIAGDMFELGARAQVVKKKSRFSLRSNRLYQLYQHYNAIDELPPLLRSEIETHYFKRTFEEVWGLVCQYKSQRNPEQLIEAQENPRLKMALIFKWYFAHCSQITRAGEVAEADNFQIFCGPAMGAFNQWVKGTRYEAWRNRHVQEIAEILMRGACTYAQALPQGQLERYASPNKKVLQAEHTSKHESAIAIIGIAGRFPQAGNLQEFWDNLASGKDSVTEIPASRWSLEHYYDPDPETPGKTYCKWMGALDDIDKFDPLFFHITPAEAELMDPQQRLFLESCWSALEDAGLNIAALSGSRCGVFVGCATGDYGMRVGQQELNGHALLGETTSVLAARISYLLNLKGPAMAIDTACSASLVAIANACNSLFLHDSDLALAGGVNVLEGPSLHIQTCKAGMLSRDGRCYTFDARANGFVPSEGVGVLVLKRLPDAIKDQDTIYGVIRAWGVNQDGKTNGITAPSAQSQQTLLQQEVYERFQINPETITLIEAHGTGTKLGDPIEVDALISAFQAYTSKQGYCALGSVKSNIGHLLTAAGVASVLKVVLALKHKMLPPTINFEHLNEHISLEESPFYVNTTLKPWQKIAESPRRAGVSAFGFCGTNAHLVIEEYEMESQVSRAEFSSAMSQPLLFLLSARDEAQLRIYAESLQRFIKVNPDLNLVDMAYTLQVGREAMEERLAFAFRSRQELQTKLQAFMSGDQVAAGSFYRGYTRDQAHRKSLAAFMADQKAMSEVLEEWKSSGAYDRLSDWWVKGLSVDWNSCYGPVRPRRLNLPTYPFARERYWVEKKSALVARGDAEILHPLVHTNVSDFSGPRYRTAWNGQEFFLADHQVQEQSVLPAAAYLEMVRAAIVLALGEQGGREVSRLTLTNVLWLRPFIFTSPSLPLQIALSPDEERTTISFEIFSQDGSEPLVYCQGQAEFIAESAPVTLDLPGLQDASRDKQISVEQVYAALQARGFTYGPRMQGLAQAWNGDSFILARLCLPAELLATWDLFVLHPSLLDAALQACIISDIQVQNSSTLLSGTPAMPFALEELQILAPLSTSLWVCLRPDASSHPTSGVRTFDLDLCDEQGQVCLRIKRLTVRSPGNLLAASHPQQEETLLLRPTWQELSLLPLESVSLPAQHFIVLAGEAADLSSSLASLLPDARLLFLYEQHKACDAQFLSYTGQLLTILQQVLQQHAQGGVLIQVVLPGRWESALHGALVGMLRTAQLENPHVRCQLFEVEPSSLTGSALSDLLLRGSTASHATHIRLQEDRYLEERWDEIEERPAQAVAWRKSGVYLITGGMGGLGRLFAAEISRHAPAATIILAGRSSLSREQQAQLPAGQVYWQVDVSDQQAVQKMIGEIRSRYKTLTGIIHAAGVLHDSFILKKSAREMQDVLASKVSGTLALDEASKDIALDFFVLFSSLSGVLGNVGQADYAAANAFLDAYAHYRQHLVANGQRQGRTLAIDWPLWSDGGMQVDGITRQILEQRLGLTALPTPAGIQAFYAALALDLPQVALLHGEPAHLSAPFFTAQAIAPVSSLAVPATQEQSAALEERATRYLATLLAPVIKMPVQRIVADVPFESYGIDSIMALQMIAQLEKVFGALPKTLFFEYQNIKSLSSYFLQAHQPHLIQLLDARTALPGTNEKQAGMPIPVQQPRHAPVAQPAEQPPRRPEQNDIAIIGLAGRYPQASDIQQFWHNLQMGLDCVTELSLQLWEYPSTFDLSEEGSGPRPTLRGGMLDNADCFDPLFFNIAPHDAELMDPQERLFLECAFATIEDAGYTRESLAVRDTVGVYVGVMYEEYQLYGAQRQLQGQAVAVPSNSSSIANRVSYFCNFQGPSVALNTMCSSSLTALHLACQSLLSGECSVALAGGVNLSLHPNKYLMLAQGKFLSSQGQCQSFGAGGDGYVPGEGVGAVLLKPLSRAVADGDHIYGLIKGSTINHGGKTNGYTVPNPVAQTNLIAGAL
ncbi:MAG TPA: SDR family NAD(P)-dependent oxidoreductase, partial [Ktedonobacteraceae bacterium]|nr:SDR family NAD(P)-dependent oxidoreductase [Ktedonobacteraceae bacterium]